MFQTLEKTIMKIIHKACPCVLRRSNTGIDLLVFEHPEAGVQIPKGSVEPGESLEAAALRELYEESGIKSARLVTKAGQFERKVGGGPKEDGPLENHPWHVFVLTPKENLPDSWEHKAEGSVAERGLKFNYFWHPLASYDTENFHPMFVNVMQMLNDHFENKPGLTQKLFPMTGV